MFTRSFTRTRRIAAAVALVTTSLGLAASPPPAAAEDDPFPYIAGGFYGTDFHPYEVGVSGDGNYLLYAWDQAYGDRSIHLVSLDDGVSPTTQLRISDLNSYVEASYLSDDGSRYFYSTDAGAFIWHTDTGLQQQLGSAGTYAWGLSGDARHAIITTDFNTFSVVDAVTGEARWNFDTNVTFANNSEVMRYELIEMPNGDDGLTATVWSFVDGSVREVRGWDLCAEELLFCSIERQKIWDEEPFTSVYEDISGPLIDYFFQTQWTSNDGSVFAIYDRGWITAHEGINAPRSKSVAEATSIDDLIHSYDYSPEDAKVTRLYQAFFNRTPDIGGLAYWIDLHHEGLSLEEVSYWFSQSDEFTLAYTGTSNDQYVARVYGNVLGRDFDQDGYNYWLGLLNDNSLDRSGVVFWVTANDEFVNEYPFLP